MIVLLLMEKAVQRIALSQEVEPGLRDAQHERLSSQLPETQHIARGGEGTVVLPALVKDVTCLFLQKPAFWLAAVHPCKGTTSVSGAFGKKAAIVSRIPFSDSIFAAPATR